LATICHGVRYLLGCLIEGVIDIVEWLIGVALVLAVEFLTMLKSGID